MVFIQDNRPAGYQMINSALGQLQDQAATEQKARQQYLAALMQGQPFDRRVALMSANPNATRGLQIPPSAMQPTADEQFQELLTRQNIANQQQFHPDQFQGDIIAATNLTGKVPGAEFTNTTAQRRYMSPEQFAASMGVQAKIIPDANAMYQQTGPLGQAQTQKATQDAFEAKQRGNLAAADTTFRSGPQTRAELALIPLRQADTAKAGAETSKIRAETQGVNSQNQLIQSLTGAGAGSATAAGPTTGSAPIPDNVSQIVKDLANRDFDPSLLRRWKPEVVAALETAVKQYDPGFNMSDYPTQVATKRSFNAGDGAKSVRSINQLIGHLKQLQVDGNKLNNTNVLPVVVNPLANAVAGQLSPESQKNQAAYNRTADAVANETETMLRGSSISGVDERKKVRSSLGQNISPASLQGAIDSTIELMNSRLRELDDQYTKGVGRGRDFSVLNPQSAAILKSFGVDPSSLDSRYGGGSARPSIGARPGTPASAPTRATTGPSDPLGILH